MKHSFHQVLQSLATGFRLAYSNLIYLVPFLLDTIIRNAYRRTPYRELPVPALTLILIILLFLIMLGYQFMLPYVIQIQERKLSQIVKMIVQGLRRLFPSLLIIFLVLFGLFFLRFMSHVVLSNNVQDFDEQMKYLGAMDVFSASIARIISVISILFVFITIFFSIEGYSPLASAKKSFWFSLNNMHFIIVIGSIILIKYGLMLKIVQLSGSHTAVKLVLQLLSEYFHFWILMSCLTFYQIQMPKKTLYSLR